MSLLLNRFRRRRRALPAPFFATSLALLLLASPLALAQEPAGPLIHSMDGLKVGNPEKNGRAETVVGRVGKAVKFSFDKDCSGAFC